jgi:hypothetical protein
VPEQAAARQQRPARAAARPAPVIVSAIPVSFAESDFSDLGENEPTEVSHMPVTETLPAAAAESAPMPDQSAGQNTPAAETVEAAPEPQHTDDEPEKLPVAAQSAVTEFIEPKPQQTGYVPVAPPSFSMPNTPSSGFDFTVRISPDNKSD